MGGKGGRVLLPPPFDISFLYLILPQSSSLLTHPLSSFPFTYLCILSPSSPFVSVLTRPFPSLQTTSLFSFHSYPSPTTTPLFFLPYPPHLFCPPSPYHVSSLFPPPSYSSCNIPSHLFPPLRSPPFTSPPSHPLPYSKMILSPSLPISPASS